MRFTTMLVAALIGWVALVPAMAGEARMPKTLEQSLLEEAPEELARAAREDGDPRLGALAFYHPQLACTKCHATGDEQSPLGPNLSQPPDEAERADPVESILLPSKAIRKGYETAVVITDEGKTLSGLLVEQNPEQLVLRDVADVDKTIVIDRQTIDEQMTSQTSIMPAGLVNSLAGRQQFLDLLAYVIEVTEKGPRRAQQLQPPAALYAAAPQPAYENDLDHAGLIRDSDQTSFRRGQKIYQSLCLSCHGTQDQPGSLPTSLRFASGSFKRGSDPYSMYQTLTKGYGLMMPQPGMVPQQKYDVIHYVREAFVKPWNPGQYAAVDDNYLAQLPLGSSRGPEPESLEPWVSMDYGPQLTASYEVGNDGSNFAYKGIAVRLDPGAGGVSRGGHWMLFDHDTLRWAAAWGGQGFIDYNGILFNGRHGVHPRIVGRVQVANPTGPGWANPRTGDFEDSRLRGRDGRFYGPLPHDWARYRGMYHFGNQVILSYTVGGASVLEMPGVDTNGTEPVFTRTLDIGPRSEELVLQVAHGENATLRTIEPAKTAVWFGQPRTSEPTAEVRFDGATWLQVDEADDFDLARRDYTIFARINTRRGGTIFSKTKPEGNWVPDGKTLFVRGGRVVFDIGWVGAVTSRRAVDDGRWHDVAMTYQRADGQVRLYIDGRLDAEGRLKPKQDVQGHVVRLGFTAPNFPWPHSFFEGQIDDVVFFDRCLQERQIEQLQAEQLPPEDTGRLEQALRGLPAPVARWRPSAVRGETAEDLTGNGHGARVLRGAAASNPAGAVVAGIWPPVDGAQWTADAQGNLRLRIPAGDGTLKFTVATARIDGDQPTESLLRRVTAGDESWDLPLLTKGGPSRWPDRLTVQGVLGNDPGPFAIDVLQHPEQNPWSCRMRLTGFDFFPDGRRAAVCTWDGDVWIADGMDPQDTGNREPGQPATFPITWQRIASGLFQPLGLKIVDGRIFVACRDQLVVLHDLNGDGETDFYENFNSDHQVTEHFHEFAMGLQTDAEGNFYYAKSARHALPALVPHHGTLLKVSRDGSRTEILAHGFRAANGVCVNPDGTFFVTDQEGHWMPKNRINWIDRPGKYYGNFWGYHDITDPSDDLMEEPLCWITNAMDRSPAELMWVDSPAWGPLQGSLLNLSYGYGKIYIIPHERIGDRMQGGICELPLPPFPTGIMRGRFHPGNGQLYTCGMYAWAANPQQPGGFYRVRYTGQPVYLPVGLKAHGQTVEISFSGQLDPKTACDPQNYRVKAWSIKRTERYGSDHFDEHDLPVESVTIAEDGRTVRLTIPALHPTRCMEIRYAIQALDGEYIDGRIHNTIHPDHP
jgi:putative heme-binding domain-containing protein